MASVSQCSSGYGLYIPIDEYKIGFCQLPVCLVTREKVYAIPIVGSCSNCTRAVVNEFDIGEFRFADSKFCYEKELITIGNTSTGTMSSTVAQVSPTQVPAPETGEISRPTIQFLLGLLDRYLGQIENQGFQSIPAGNVKWPVGVPRTSEWEPNVRDPTIIIEDNGDANPLGAASDRGLPQTSNEPNQPPSLIPDQGQDNQPTTPNEPLFDVTIPPAGTDSPNVPLSTERVFNAPNDPALPRSGSGIDTSNKNSAIPAATVPTVSQPTASTSPNEAVSLSIPSFFFYLLF